MNRRWVAASAAVGISLPLFADLSSAQAQGDALSGKGFAERVCSECHAVGSGEMRSPHPQAPSFTTVANAPGRNATSLRVWFQSPHRSMPELKIGEKDSEDLIAYILSLKKPS